MITITETVWMSKTSAELFVHKEQIVVVDVIIKGEKVKQTYKSSYLKGEHCFFNGVSKKDLIRGYECLHEL